MLVIILLAAIIAFCLGYAVYFFIQKIPAIHSLDIDSLPQEKKIAAKAKIIEAKFWRDSQKWRDSLNKVLLPHKDYLSGRIKRFSETVMAIENKYQPQVKIAPVVRTTGELFAAAQELIAQADFTKAEKTLIEIISRHKKNLRAYELLGEIYSETKDYDKAEEIYKYLIKAQILGEKKSAKKFVKSEELAAVEADALSGLTADNKLVAYYSDLAGIYELKEKNDKALDAYLKALALEPNNPKYLDRVINLSIKLGDKGLAKKTYRWLQKINPENGKLSDLAAALEKMK